MSKNPWEAGSRATARKWQAQAPCAASSLIFTGPEALAPRDPPAAWDGVDPQAGLALVCGIPPREPSEAERNALDGLLENLGSSCWFVVGDRFHQQYNCHGLTRARAIAIANQKRSPPLPLDLITIGFAELEQGMRELGFTFHPSVDRRLLARAFAVVFGEDRGHSASRAFFTTVDDTVMWDSKLGYQGAPEESLRILHSLDALRGRNYGDPVGCFVA